MDAITTLLLLLAVLAMLRRSGDHGRADANVTYRYNDSLYDARSLNKRIE